MKFDGMKKFWMGIFVDLEGELKSSAVAYIVSYIVFMIVAGRSALSGQWDPLTYGLGSVAITLNYAAVVASRARTKAIFKRLIERVTALEACVGIQGGDQ